MYPFIDLYFIQIPTFGLMVASAFVICHYFLKKEFKAKKLEEKILEDIIFYAALSAIIGSKIYYLIEKSLSDSGSFFSNIKDNVMCAHCDGFVEHVQNFGTGLTFNGGLICALIFIGIYIIDQKLDFIFLADIITPYILLGHGIGRVGCFLVGDDYGVPSDLPWAVTFSEGSPVSDVTTFTQIYNYNLNDLKAYFIEGTNYISVHPTQLYEMSLYFISFLIIKKFYNQISKTKGLAFSLYLILGGLSRFSVEFLRLNNRYFLDLSSAQYISLFMIIFGLFFIFYQRKVKLSN